MRRGPPPTINSTLSGLKFFFDVTLGHAELLVKVQPVRPAMLDMRCSFHSNCPEGYLMSRTLDRALALARSAQGPIAPHLEAFAVSFIAQQYSTFCVHSKVYRAVQLSAWLERRSSATAALDVDEALVEGYLRAAMNDRASSLAIARFELHQLLLFMREHGWVSTPASVPMDPVDETIWSATELAQISQSSVSLATRWIRRPTTGEANLMNA